MSSPELDRIIRQWRSARRRFDEAVVDRRDVLVHVSAGEVADRHDPTVLDRLCVARRPPYVVPAPEEEGLGGGRKVGQGRRASVPLEARGVR
jgi:hypothetical protein